MFEWKRKNYKFSDKRHSKKGILSSCLTFVSLLLLLFSFYYSAATGGKGSMLLGFLGIFAMFISFAGIVLAAKGFREEDIVYTFPVVGIVGSSLLFLVSLLLYIVGFVL